MSWLELIDFRNYGHEEVSFGAGLNLVVGSNGEGKTNLLEAIHVLCAFGSHRASAVEPLVRMGAERAILRCRGHARGREVAVDAQLAKGRGIRVSLNKVSLSKVDGLSSGIAAVLFAPEDLAIVKGGPEERRRFLDLACARVRPRAAAERQEFERALRQRNAALRSIQRTRSGYDTLDVWDGAFASSAAIVVRNRLAMLARLAGPAAGRYREVAGSGAEVRLSYAASWQARGPAGGQAGADEVEAGLRSALSAQRAAEVERGRSLVGPQRDDLLIELDGADARLFASQGESRTIALALRLAERELVAEAWGEDPVLLLDDVFSELDPGRSAALMEMMGSGSQTIVTSASTAGLSLGGRVLQVSGGRVSLDG